MLLIQVEEVFAVFGLSLESFVLFYFILFYFWLSS